MKKYKLILLFLIHIIPSFGQDNRIDWDGLTNLPQGTEIAIGIIENGTIQKYGFTVEKNELKTKPNSHTLFEIGSITKVFTTLSALKILNDKQIALSQPIAHYLPNAENTSDKITFYKLMMHTSGLPKVPNNFFWSTVRCPSDPFQHYCEKRMYRFLNKFRPTDNENFTYSNLGMGLLGYVSSNIENAPLNSILKSEIFKPLSMTSTSLGIKKEQFHLVANPKGLNGEPKRTWKFSDVTEGAGNAYSNIDDMTLFLKSIFEQDNINTDLFQPILKMEDEQLRIDTSESMGLGWRIHHNKSKIIYHGGITYGFKSLIAYSRIQEKGIVILTNAKGFSRKENKLLKELCFNYLEEK